MKKNLRCLCFSRYFRQNGEPFRYTRLQRHLMRNFLLYQRAIQILEDNKEKLTTLAEQLLKREVIFQDDLEKIFGKRPHELTLTEVATVEENESKDPKPDSSAPTE